MINSNKCKPNVKLPVADSLLVIIFFLPKERKRLIPNLRCRHLPRAPFFPLQDQKPITCHDWKPKWGFECSKASHPILNTPCSPPPCRGPKSVFTSLLSYIHVSSNLHFIDNPSGVHTRNSCHSCQRVALAQCNISTAVIHEVNQLW